MQKLHYLTYVSQLDPIKANWGVGDCGIACATMIITTVTQHRPTVNEVSKAVNMLRGYEIATLGKVVEAGAKYDVKLTLLEKMKIADIERELNDGRGIIWLVHYPRLLHKYSGTYGKGHFITIHGMDDNNFYYDDPFWPSQKDGDHIRISKKALIDASYAQGSTFDVPPGGFGIVMRSHRLPTVGTKTPPPPPPPLPSGLVRLSGTLTDEKGKPLANTSVRLYSKVALPNVKGLVVKVPARGDVIWDRPLTGFFGSRWDCWNQYVREQSGLPFELFKNDVLDKNPQLVADEYVFKTEKQYLIPSPISTLAWSRAVTGVAGSRWQAYEARVKGKVKGITGETFIKDAGLYNSSLATTGQVFQAERVYRFPENLWGGNSVEWTREVTGVSGSRWEAWEQHVKSVVPALFTEASFAEFSDKVQELNPTLKADGSVFQPGKTYKFPVAVPQDMLACIVFTDDMGRYTFEGLPPGSYELEVQPPTLPSHRRLVTVNSTKTLDMVIREVTKEVVLDPAEHAVPAGMVYTQHGRFMVNGNALHVTGRYVPDLVHQSDSDQIATLTALQADGVNVVRVIAARRDLSVKTIIARVEALLDRLEAYNLYAVVAFTDANLGSGLHLKGDGEYDVDGRLSVGWYEQEFRAHYLPFAKKAAKALHPHPRLLAWELGHDLNPMLGENANPETLLIFAAAVSEAIRNADPHHLLSVGIPSTGSVGMDEEQAKRLYRLPAINLASAYLAPTPTDENTRAIDVKDLEALAHHYGEQDAQLARRLGIPFLLTLPTDNAAAWQELDGVYVIQA